MSTFPLRVGTPDGLLYEGDVARVVCRTISGDLAILPGHCNYCTALGMGEAHIVLEDGTRRNAACIGGMLSMMNGVCRVLATTWEWEEDIDAERAEAAKHRAEQALAAGGLTYIARRAAENAAASTGKDLLPFLTEGFTAAAMAKVGTSALESRKLGYLLDSDVIVPHKDEVLFVAINEARAMAASGWRAPHRRSFPVVGRSGVATIRAQLVNMRDGGFISAHDFHIASLIANVLCGGDVDAGTLVTEEYLMTLERKAFCSLLEHPKTQERIMGMLSTGKPVRN